MGRAFFRSLQSIGPDVPVTATDADPNTTAPAETRVLKQSAASGVAGGLRIARGVHLYATFVAGTTPSFDGQLWIKDAAGGWLAFGSALTGLDGVIQTVASVPAGLDVFFQVTAINGTPTSGIPRLIAE